MSSFHSFNVISPPTSPPRGSMEVVDPDVSERNGWSASLVAPLLREDAVDGTRVATLHDTHSSALRPDKSSPSSSGYIPPDMSTTDSPPLSSTTTRSDEHRASVTLPAITSSDTKLDNHDSFGMSSHPLSHEHLTDSHVTFAQLTSAPHDPQQHSASHSAPQSPNTQQRKTQSKWDRKLRKLKYFTDTMSSSQLALMIFHMTILLILWVTNNVLWIFVSTRFSQDYAFFVDQCTTLLFLLFGTPVVLYRIFWTKAITPDMRKFPLGRMVTIGLFDSLYGLLTTMGSVYTPGPYQTLLFCIPIPVCMIISYIFLKNRYVRGQYLGAFIISVGSVVAIGPAFWSPDSSSSNTQGTRAGSVVVYALGVLFFSINAVYKEWALKTTTLDLLYLLMVENWWNWFLTYLITPVLFIPGVGNDTPSTVVPNFVGGAQCFFQGVSPSDPTADCSGVWLVTVFYALTNMLVNVWMLITMALGSAVIMNIVNSLQLPVTNGIFAVPAIMGSKLVVSFDNMQLVGLVTTCVGFGVYQFLPLEKDLPSLTIVPPEGVGDNSNLKRRTFTFRGVGAMAPSIQDKDLVSEYRYSYLDRLGFRRRNQSFQTNLEADYSERINHMLTADPNGAYSDKGGSDFRQN